MISVQHMVMGILENNVYVVSDTKGTFVVDPSARCDRIVEALDGAKLDAIVCTHFHSDHTGALADLKAQTGATVYVSEPDAHYVENPRKVGTSPVPLQKACAVDERVADSQVIRVGQTDWTVILTPGHSKGSMCLYKPAGDEVVVNGKSLGKVPVLFSGDTLFAGTTGRTDFLGGSMADMAESLQRLAQLPDETVVFTGHNDFTTIGIERRTTFPRWGVM